MWRVVVGAMLVGLWAAPAASAQRIDGLVSMKVDQKRCGFAAGVVECVVPSGKAIRVTGRMESSRDPIVGAPMRLQSGPNTVAQAVTDSDGQFAMAYVPPVTGTNLQVEIQVGGAWQVVAGTVARATVFVDLTGIQTSSGRGHPITVFGRIRWYDRVGAGRVRLLRCRYAQTTRCRDPAAFRETLVSKRLRARGGSAFRLTTRRRRAYGRMLMLRYEPDDPVAVQGDVLLLRRVSPRQR